MFHRFHFSTERVNLICWIILITIYLSIHSLPLSPSINHRVSLWTIVFPPLWWNSEDHSWASVLLKAFDSFVFALEPKFFISLSLLFASYSHGYSSLVFTTIVSIHAEYDYEHKNTTCTLEWLQSLLSFNFYQLSSDRWAWFFWWINFDCKTYDMWRQIRFKES